MLGGVVFFVFIAATPDVSLLAQQSDTDVVAEAEAPVAAIEQVDEKWILRFEQAYGIPGLYVVEPPAQEGDENALIRRDLVMLTQQAWVFLNDKPDEVPSLEAMVAAGLIDSVPAKAAEAEYHWNPESRSYVSNRGNEGNIVFGAFQQLREAEEYRSRVATGSEESFQKLTELATRLEGPELIKREVEARLFTKRQLEFEQVKLLAKVQELLAQLATAIRRGNEYGYFPPDQDLTMRTVGEFGLIDTLEALPKGGEYVLGKPSELPRAKYGERMITLSPGEVPALILRNVNFYLEANPEYPPALALRARYSGKEQAWADINKAIELWGDCPAFRVQRVAMAFDLPNTTFLQQDLEYLFSRFPSTPVLLELITATSDSPYPELQEWHHAIVEKAVVVRPEVLNLQLIRFKLAQQEGHPEQAAESWEYLVRRHPGYAPLLTLPKRTSSNSDTPAASE